MLWLHRGVWLSSSPTILWRTSNWLVQTAKMTSRYCRFLSQACGLYLSVIFRRFEKASGSWLLTSPVSPGSSARLEIQTAAGAVCNILVVYKAGPSQARGLEPKVADARGQISWVWRVGTNTSSGTWPILVECAFGNQRAETQTEFTVR